MLTNHADQSLLGWWQCGAVSQALLQALRALLLLIARLTGRVCYQTQRWQRRWCEWKHQS
jgi:hypothetical protein